MATGICYTQSGGMKKYEDKVYISLVKGTHDLPTIKNNVLSIINPLLYKSYFITDHNTRYTTPR